MTNEDRRNPEVVGFLTAALHYAAVRRAERKGEPTPSAADVEKHVQRVIHLDPLTNKTWYMLLEQIFTFDERQEALQKQIDQQVNKWKETVGILPVPLIPREDWRGSTVEACQEQVMQGMGIPAHLAGGTPQYGTPVLQKVLPALHALHRLRRWPGPPQVPFEAQHQNDPPAKDDGIVRQGAYELQTTEFDADTLVVNKNDDAYRKKDTIAGVVVTVVDDDDPQPILVNDTKPQ